MRVLRRTEKKTVSTAFFSAMVYDARPDILFRATVAGITILEYDMSKDERKEMIENIAERFTQMDDVDKSYIAGYMAGKQEERQKWEQQGKTAVATA